MRGTLAALASLTKGGLDVVTRSLAIEYADKGIRVNAVAPGIIKTPMHAPETHSFRAGLHPLGRMGEVQEVVDTVLYLESAAFVTGETTHVDGGAMPATGRRQRNPFRFGGKRFKRLLLLVGGVQFNRHCVRC